jgi:4-hydroxy-tetrahydrodipicolinate synthase
LKGVCPVLVSPCKPDFELNEEAVKALTRHVMEQRRPEDFGALVVTGSGGEGALLKMAERKRIFELVMEETKGEIVVVAGCQHSNTREALELAQHAEKVGLDGVMVTPSFYWPPSDDSVIYHFKTIAEAINIGIIVYNNWVVTQFDIPVDLMEKLAEIPNIVSIKENTHIIHKFAAMVDRMGDKIAVLNGSGRINEPYAHFIGATGFVEGTASILLTTLQDIFKASREGNYQKAKDIRRRLVPLRTFMAEPKSVGRYIAVLHAMAEELGLPAGPPRPPILPLTDQERVQMREMMKKAGVP